MNSIEKLQTENETLARAPDATPHPLRVLGVRKSIAHVGQPGVRTAHNKETKERNES